MDRRDLHAHAVVVLLAVGRRPRLPGVEPRARDLQRTAQQPDGERGLLLGDEREPHGFSFAKKAVAFLRNSPMGCGSREQHESHLLRAPAEIVEDTLAVAGFVVRGAGIGVSQAEAKRVVKQDGGLPRGGVTALALPIRAARRR